MKNNTNGLFLPFQLSANQTLAPIVHNSVKERFVLGAFDASIKGQDLNRNELYIELLKNSNYKPFKNTKQQSSQPEIIIEDDFDNNGNERKFYKIKHLQFHQNVRPPYRGTWTKKSRVLSGRKPFNKDSQFFDYEVDSDEEWEEGGPGESLDGSDSDGSLKDDYEIDNEFFVPHGYLSPDENDEIEQQLIQNNNNNDNNVHMIDTQSEGKEPKCGPLLKEQVLMAERNRSFSKTLIPVVIGCVWESNTDQNNQKFVESLQQFKRISLKHKKINY
jgi:chromatin assembly factor 1 subunit A